MSTDQPFSYDHDGSTSWNEEMTTNDTIHRACYLDAVNRKGYAGTFEQWMDEPQLIEEDGFIQAYSRDGRWIETRQPEQQQQEADLENKITTKITKQQVREMARHVKGRLNTFWHVTMFVYPNGNYKTILDTGAMYPDAIALQFAPLEPELNKPPTVSELHDQIRDFIDKHSENL